MSETKLKKLRYDKVWTNSEDFPTFESDEKTVREDMQYLYEVIRKWALTLTNREDDDDDELDTEIGIDARTVPFSDPDEHVQGDTVYAALKSLYDIVKEAEEGVVPPSSITTSQIAEDAVTAEKIADHAIEDGHLSTTVGKQPVSTDTIQDAAVTTDKIEDGAVTSEKIGSKEVETENLADRAVSTGKLGLGAVNTANIVANAVTADKVSFYYAVSSEKGGSATSAEKVNHNITFPDGTSFDGSGAVTVPAQTPAAHDQGAATVTAGTFPETIVAHNPSVGEAAIRNIIAGTDVPSALDTGAIYLLYE